LASVGGAASSLSDATSRGVRDERSEMWATAAASGIGGLGFAGLGCPASALARGALVGTGGCGTVVHTVGREGRARRGLTRGRTHGGRQIHRRAEKVGTSFCLQFVLFSSRDSIVQTIWMVYTPCIMTN
jgi:hypothetical protein